MTEDLKQIYPKDKKFTSDLSGVKLPYDLLDCFKSIVDEITRKKYKYKYMNEDDELSITFEKPKNRIIISVYSENLMVRHFDISNKDKRKLLVLYVEKPTQRNFKLL